MTTTKTTYHHGDLKRALIAQALTTIEASGAQKLSLRACARALDVDVAATYRHFKHKNALLAAVAATGFGQLAQAMSARIAHTQEPREVFFGLGESYIGFAVAHRHLYRLMFGGQCLVTDISTQGQELLNPNQPDAHALLVTALDALHTSGDIPSALRPGAETLAWAAMHGLASLIIEERCELLDAHGKTRARACCAMILDGLGAPAP
jgi:AcrR family transcriptional regulator